MKYFTHNSDASKAVRLRKFVRRFGAAGYGLWWMLVEAAATDMESCGGWLHPSFDMEELALNAGFGSLSDILPMLSMLESLRDEDGLGLIVRGVGGRVGIPSLRLHLSEHLAKKNKRTSGDWVPFSGVLMPNSGVPPETSSTLSEFLPQTPVLKEKRGEEKRGEENPPTPRKRGKRPQADACEGPDPFGWSDFAAVYPGFRLKPDKAAKAWFRRNVTDTAEGRQVLAQIIGNVVQWNLSEQWIQGRVPNCSKYLDEGIWQGVPGPPPYRSGQAGQEDIFKGLESWERS